jgi:ketosteroid isomerase-like protein
MNRVFFVVLLLLTVPCVWADPNPVDIGPEATLRAFIHAFDNLDWDKFRSFFADDATVFYPRGIPRRARRV